jgi:hypothetical protein
MARLLLRRGHSSIPWGAAKDLDWEPELSDMSCFFTRNRLLPTCQFPLAESVAWR